MPAAVKTSVTELPESRVRVEAEVPAAEIERRMQATARQLGQNLRMPGFRKGKVPPPVVIQRIGRESVLDETVRGAMGRWYSMRSTPRASTRSATPSSTSATSPTRASR